MEYVYHGSAVPGIERLEARSVLHGTDQKIVYLTDNVPYALFYIWDEGVTGSPGKHVTGAVRGGTAYYEEQFPRQLERFYRGASGWLYSAPKTPEIRAVENREGLFYNLGNTPVQSRHIPDVYEELLRHEAAGELVALRFEEQTQRRQDELIGLAAEAVVRADFYREDEVQRAFMKKYFARAGNGRKQGIQQRTKKEASQWRTN